jgi:4-carboxymuconolactone decarboxylase
MRLDKPRVEPLPATEIDPEIRRLLPDGDPINIFRTLANHPKLLKRWLVFGAHVLAKSSLPPRDRELLILRVGWLARAEYEWSRHVPIARSCGVTDEEIERVMQGSDAPGWSDLERALLRAVDELHTDHFITDATWSALSQHYDTKQLMDLVFTVGQYNMVSMALNTLGVQLDPDVTGFSRP